MQTDDLLQFKDYSSTPSNATTTSPPAQINVNSPTHSNEPSGYRQRGDPLSNLVYDINNSMSGSSGMGGNMTTIPIDEEATSPHSDGSDNNSTSTTINNKKLSFLTLEYYQQFFNVDTYMVLERIVNSIIPKRAAANYLRSHIGTNADLYGPFWINVTLIFSIAISGNIASYLQYAKDDYQWRYNFHLVSYAATCIFIYINLVPFALWLLFKYSLKPIQEGMETESADYTPSLLALMCIYGYSLSIYIPVSILWVIQISILQWLLVITAALLSGSVLIFIMTPALRNSRFSLFLIVGILAAHFLLAAGFMLYFFHVPTTTTHTTESVFRTINYAESFSSTPSLVVKNMMTSNISLQKV